MATSLDLLRAAIAAEPLPTSVLAVCHGPGDVDYLGYTEELRAKLWVRAAGLPQAPQPWPDAGLYDAVILPLPANRETLSLCLTAACARLAKDGTLYLFGQNETGIKSADKWLATYFNDVELLSIGGHGRLFAARKPMQQDYTLDGFRQQMQLPIVGAMASYPGLFAKGKLDNATAFLLENLPEVTAQSQVLDFACGIGVIAKAITLQQSEADLTLVDNDALALAAASLNLPRASLQCAATPAEITGTYNLILSNPPIHDGQTLSYEIVEALLVQLPRLLVPKGEAYIVAQVTVPVIRIAGQKKLAATEVAANKSFRITKITR